MVPSSGMAMLMVAGEFLRAAAAGIGIVKILFYVFLMVFVVTLIKGLTGTAHAGVTRYP